MNNIKIANIHKKYIYEGKLLTCGQIAILKGYKTSYVYNKIYKKKLSEGSNVTNLINTKMVLKNNIGNKKVKTGIKAPVSLDVAKGIILGKIDVAKLEKHKSVKSLSKENKARSLTVYRKIYKFLEMDPSLKTLAIENEKFVGMYIHIAMSEIYPFYLEVFLMVLTDMLSYDKTSNSSMNAYITGEYGDRKNLKDSVRAVLTTLTNLGVIKTVVTHRRDTTYELNSELECRLHIELISKYGNIVKPMQAMGFQFD